MDKRILFTHHASRITLHGLFFVLFIATPALAGIQWYTLADGMKRAADEQKPMIVDFFYGKGCPRCESLQKNVYDNPDVAKKISDDFVPIRVDLTKKLSDQEVALGNKYAFKKDCLLLFLDYKGDLIEGPGGKRLCFAESLSPEQFLQYLQMVKGK